MFTPLEGVKELDPQTILTIQLLKPQLEGLVNNLNWDHLFSPDEDGYPKMEMKHVIQFGCSLKNVGFDLADNPSFMKNLHKIVVKEIDPVTLKKLEEAGVLDLSVEFFEKLFTVNGKYEAENCMCERSPT